MENLKFNEVKKGDKVTFYDGIEFYKELEILSDDLEIIANGVESFLMERDFKDNHVFKALIPLEEYLLNTKCYGTKKVRFIEFQEVVDKGEKPYQIAVFRDHEMGINWIVEEWNLTKKVFEIVTSF